MNKKELIEEIASRLEIEKKQARQFIDSFEEIIKEEVLERGKTISIRGFGKFEQVIRKSKKIRVPQSKKTIKTKPLRTVKFKPGDDLKIYLK